MKVHKIVCRPALGMVLAAVACLAIPANAIVNELVGSSESHSIEKFNNAGVWQRTFASTGPWIPFSIAASPLTNDVFVATNTGPKTNIILRYTSTGAQFGPGGSYWATFNVFPWFSNNPVQSILFDSAGNLWVASGLGTGGFQVVILKFPAAQLLNMAPAPSMSIATTVGRGNQMAFDRFGDLCIASFISPNTVQCYSPTSGALVFDYAAEFAGFTPTIQPVGLYFGPNNNLYVSSVFAGQIAFEQIEQAGPMVSLTTGLVHDVGYIAVDSAGSLYVPSYHNPEGRYETSPLCVFYACMDYDTSSDVVYKINPGTGVATKFISRHIWGPYQMIFVPF